MPTHFMYMHVHVHVYMTDWPWWSHANTLHNVHSTYSIQVMHGLLSITVPYHLGTRLQLEQRDVLVAAIPSRTESRGWPSYFCKLYTPALLKTTPHSSEHLSSVHSNLKLKVCHTACFCKAQAD